MFHVGFNIRTRMNFIVDVWPIRGFEHKIATIHIKTLYHFQAYAPSNRCRTCQIWHASGNKSSDFMKSTIRCAKIFAPAETTTNMILYGADFDNDLPLRNTMSFVHDDCHNSA